MNIVMLERESVGWDIDVSCFAQLGVLTIYDTLEPELLAEQIRKADVILSNKATLSGELLAQAPSCKMIAEMATGFDNIDLEYCRKHGIAVANAGHYSTESVVQHTFALALSLLGKVQSYDTLVKDGTYARQKSFTIFDHPIIELYGKTWGIAGLGMIGKRVAQIAEAFGCHVVTYSTSGSRTDSAYESLDLEAFLAQSDIISVHCPLSERTRHLFDKNAFSKMKESAILINVARGPVVDQAALVQALLSGQIAGAGIDVFEKEPIDAADPLLQIQDSEHLILTPHMAWASREARQRDVQTTFENVQAFLAGERKNRIV